MARSRQRMERFLLDLLEPIGRSERQHWGELYVRGLLQDAEQGRIYQRQRQTLHGKDHPVDPLPLSKPASRASEARRTDCPPGGTTFWS